MLGYIPYFWRYPVCVWYTTHNKDECRGLSIAPMAVRNVRTYILHTGYTITDIAHMCNDDSALSVCAWDLEPMEIERLGSKGPPIGNGIWRVDRSRVTWPIASRDPKRSNTSPQYVLGPLSWQRLEIPTWFQWNSCRKWLLNWGLKWSRARWYHVIIKGQNRPPGIFRCKYLEIYYGYRLDSKGLPIWNASKPSRVQWKPYGTIEPKITTLSCLQPDLWQFKE